jgi:hypothetical protein
MRTPSLHRLLYVFLLLAAGLPVMASPVIGMPAPVMVPPENWEAREKLRATIFAPLAEAMAGRRTVITQSASSSRVQFRTDRQSGAVYLIFANQRGREYPLDGAGTFIIKRSRTDGSFLQAKLFVQDGPGSYLRFFPLEDRTVMDVVLFDHAFQTQIALPISFDRLLTASFATIMDLSASSVDWQTVLAPAERDGDRRLQRIIATVRPRLRGLRDMDDGAMDSAGKMVTIATGESAGRGGFNCSGFAKWIVDGFFAPLTGANTDIAALKSRNAGKAHSWSSRYEEELDPYFGLDWSRGLARSLELARSGASPSDVDIDVRADDRIAYVADTGYAVPDLQYVLYFLTREIPGRIYLGSVNAPSIPSVSEGTPTLRMHHHVVVLFPYFDPEGRFQVVVMERNLETGLSSLTRRYGRESVHLVHIDSDGELRLPKID